MAQVGSFKLLCTADIKVMEFVDFGDTLVGKRRDAYFEADLVGDLLTGDYRGVDYLLIRNDGVTEINARGAITTDDGAKISAEVYGFSANGVITEPYVRFLTSDNNYKWLSKTIVIGKGESTREGGRIEYFYNSLE